MRARPQGSRRSRRPGYRRVQPVDRTRQERAEKQTRRRSRQGVIPNFKFEISKTGGRKRPPVLFFVDYGGKRSATPLWTGEAKAPSPLRFHGALHNFSSCPLRPFAANISKIL